MTDTRDNALAVIGLACRLPLGDDPREVWRNLADGVEAIRTFSDDELREAGVDPALLADPMYVKAAPCIDGVEDFDAAFFGFTPREAEILDPQQRALLECAYRALEDAGRARIDRLGDIGIYVGVSSSSYVNHLATRPDVVDAMGLMALSIANDKDFVASQIAYRLNLTGPAVNIATACSTSLVAIHAACGALLNYECDLALAGGASVRARQVEGYLHQDGGVLSPDGHCRPFSAQAAGTIGGSGAAMVLLKRLEDALADGDAIYAVVAGSAVNNDGSDKLGFTAPSMTRQARVVREALAVAGIEARDVGYVEAHGTATPLGDPVEIAALAEAHGDARSRCAIGSIKSNIGHLDAAAGVAGFVKTALSIEAGEIAPSLHYDAPNPQIDFARSRFFVAAGRQPWPLAGPRRAGVSSFGIGGTNAHVVLEQAPALPRRTDAAPRDEIFVVSAKHPQALAATRDRLAAAIGELPAGAFADASHSLVDGRPAYAERAALVAATPQAVRDGRWIEGRGAEPCKVAWLFPGQGSQHVGMARGLYAAEPVFRDTIDRCADWVRRHAGWDLVDLIWPADAAGRERSQTELGQTQRTQVAVFAVEIALARLWLSLGAEPDLMLGHSLGEYVVACVAGVVSLDDALRLVEARGRLVGMLPPGAMLGIPLGAGDVRPLLGDGIELCAINAPGHCTLGGPVDAIAALEARLARDGVKATRLETSHAFHTAALQPILGAFRDIVASIDLRAPRLPYVSAATGRRIEATEARDPDYWVRHLRETVDFAGAMRTLAEQPGTWRYLDVGPGGGAASLARHNGIDASSIVRSLPHRHDETCARRAWLNAVARLWCDGVDLELTLLHAGSERRRVHLPGYAFHRTRHWIEPAEPHEISAAQHALADALPLHRCTWRPYAPTPGDVLPQRNRLVFADVDGRLQRALHGVEGVVRVAVGDAFERDTAGHYQIRPDVRGDYLRLFDDLRLRRLPIDEIVYGWPLDMPSRCDGLDCLVGLQDDLATLVSACKRKLSATPIAVCVLTRNAFQIGGADPVLPEQRGLAAMLTVLAQEEPDWRCRVVDVGDAVDTRGLRRALADDATERGARVVALRGNHAWLPGFERIARAAGSDDPYPGRCVVVIGGLGAIGSEFVVKLAGRGARTVAIGRRAEASLAAAPALRLARLRDAGLVDYRATDVGDPDALRSVLRDIADRHGGIDLVVNAAAAMDADAYVALADCDAQAFARHNRAKVEGCLALIDAAAGADVRRVVLMSSLAGTLGGLGMGPYAAANAYMDGLVEAPWLRHLPGDWYAVAWDGLVAAPADVGNGNAFHADAALDLVATLVTTHAPGFYLASHDDIDRRWRRWGAGQPQQETLRGAAARDAAHGDYVEPANGTEQLVAEAYEALIGIRPIGARDDFFALGGDSLLATQLCSRLRRACAVDLPIAAIFEYPVVADLAVQILLDKGAAAVGDAELLALVQSVEDLDEAALRELLAE